MKWLFGLVAALGITGIAAATYAATRSLPRSSVYIRNRTIYGPGGFQYYLTDDDLLWLARAVWGESGEHERDGAAVAWAMAQNHALLVGRSRPRFSTFGALLRAYCQPINPRFATPTSSGCIERPSHCTERLLARRRMITNAPWSRIPQSVRDLVASFSRGTLENPVPGMTDWAAMNWQSRSQVPLIRIRNYFGVGRDRRIYGGE